MKKILFMALAGIVLVMPCMAQEFDHQIEALITGGGYELEESIPATKIIRDGQVFILRGEKTYTVTGQEVR